MKFNPKTIVDVYNCLDTIKESTNDYIDLIVPKTIDSFLITVFFDRFRFINYELGEVSDTSDGNTLILIRRKI